MCKGEALKLAKYNLAALPPPLGLDIAEGAVDGTNQRRGPLVD